MFTVQFSKNCIFITFDYKIRLWSAITEIIARGEVEDNYLIRDRTSTSGIRAVMDPGVEN